MARITVRIVAAVAMKSALSVAFGNEQRTLGTSMLQVAVRQSYSASAGCSKVRYAQCGGGGFTGDACCPDGMWCMYSNEWWSQCEPCSETWNSEACSDSTPAAATGCSNGKYAQCGGGGFTGDACCPDSMWCMYSNEWWSQCEPCSEAWNAEACSDSTPAATPTPRPTPLSPAPASGDCSAGWQPARWTWYQSYAPCCQDSPNYDPSADTTECDVYNACQWSGRFAYVTGQKSLDWVKSNNIVAFFSSRGDNRDYANKRLRVQAAGKTVELTVYDTCGDSDCNGCCTGNAAGYGGYLVDMEYWTVVKNFPQGTSAVAGQVCWQVVG